VLGAVLALLLWAGFAPVRSTSHELLFEIPKGTHARRMKGEQIRNLPTEVRLTLGVQDVLLLRNRDTVPQVFGPLRVMPGTEFRLPFEQVSDYEVACSAQDSGQMTVRVVQLPDPGWHRLRWRAEGLVHAIRYLPLKGPEIT
jgi:hypothetical protein